MKLATPVVLLLALAASGWAQSSPTAADSSSFSFNLSVHDHWFGQDKAHHFMASAFLTGFSYYMMKQEFDQTKETATLSAVSFSLSIGLAKEIYDRVSRKGTPSFKDIVADVTGIAVGVFILNITSN
jgi:putative lipoprotein